MARTKSKPASKQETAAAKVVKLSGETPHESTCAPDSKSNGWSEMFSKAACVTAHWMGKPISFLFAAAAVIVWAASGPLFGFSDTWQLVINTSTTIITFLMVFLIQNTQNRDTMAVQLKLSELIIAVNQAENRFAKAEDLSDKELEALHEELRKQADTTLDHLNDRRGGQKKAS